MSEIYEGYNQIFEDKYLDEKYDYQIFMKHKMCSSSFYEFRKQAESAFTNQMIKLGYEFEILKEILEELKEK